MVGLEYIDVGSSKDVMRAPPCLRQGSNDCFTRLGGRLYKKYGLLEKVVLFFCYSGNFVFSFLKKTISIGAETNAERI